MTFKECRKYGREILTNTFCRGYGFMYLDKLGNWYFDLAHINDCDLRFVLEKSGVVDKVVDGLWLWDWYKRGFRPKNEKGWNKNPENLREWNRRLRKRN